MAEHEALRRSSRQQDQRTRSTSCPKSGQRHQTKNANTPWQRFARGFLLFDGRRMVHGGDNSRKRGEQAGGGYVVGLLESGRARPRTQVQRPNTVPPTRTHRSPTDVGSPWSPRQRPGGGAGVQRASHHSLCPEGTHSLCPPSPPPGTHTQWALAAASAASRTATRAASGSLPAPRALAWATRPAGRPLP